MYYSNCIESLFEAVTSAGFDVSTNNETDFRVTVNGAWGKYDIYAIYNSIQDVIDFSVPLSLKDYSINGVKVTDVIDLSFLERMVKIANSNLEIGCFKVYGQDVVYTIQVPLVQYLRISAQLIEHLVNMILDVCDLFLPGYILALNDKDKDIKKFELLIIKPVREVTFN